MWPAERACAAALRSFRPGPGWLRDDLVAYFQNQQRQFGMIEQTVQRVLGMQSQVAAELRESTYQVGVDWAKTLGPSIDLVDPASGDLYNVFDNTWSYYCLTPSGAHLFGTNDPQTVQSPDCGTQLKRAR